MERGLKIFLAVFFLFNLVVSSFYLDSWKNGNTTSRALPVITFFESGTFRIDRYQEMTVDKAHVNDHYYTDKAPLPTYVMIPFFGILKWAGLITPDENGSLFGDHIYLLGGFLTGSLPFALILSMMFRRIKKYGTGISPVVLSTLPLIGSFVFIFTGTYFAHMLSAWLLLVSYLQIRKKRFLWAGLAGGLAFLCEYNLAIILLLWGAVMLYRERKAKPFISYSLGILPALLFMLVYNAIFSTSPFTFLYKYHTFGALETNYGFRLPSFGSLFGLTVSPYRGIFFYAPVLLAGLYYFYKNYRERGLRPTFGSYIFLPFTVYFIFIASYFGWWGGWTYGPRLLLAMVPILVYRIIEYYTERPFKKPVFYFLVVAGLVLMIPAKATIVYSAPTGVMDPFTELVIGGFRNGNLNPNNLLTMLFRVDPLISFLFFAAFLLTGQFILTRWYNRWLVQ